MAESIAGRYDIVVFTNGGWECIGRQASVPPAPEGAYRPKVQEFIATLKMPQDAGTYSMRYVYDGAACSVAWTPIDQ